VAGWLGEVLQVLRARTCGKYVSCKSVFWVPQDPEGILAAPQPGHIARRSYQRKLEEDVEEKERVEKQMQDERERRRFAREVKP
jgi:hypothetical protein